MHGLLEVGEGLERGDLVATNVAGGGSFLRRARRRISAPFWRHGWLRTVAAARAAGGVDDADLPRRAGGAVRLRVLDAWTRSPGRSSTPGASTTSARSSRAAPSTGVIWRTVGISAAVTVTCAVLAFPFAYFMARLATPRLRAMLFVLVLLPLWSSYLVRVYAWKVILAQRRDPELVAGEARPSRASNIGYTNWAMWLVFTLHLAAVHDPAGLRGARADPALVHRGIARPRRARLHDVPRG